MKAYRPGIEPASCKSQVHHAKRDCCHCQLLHVSVTVCVLYAVSTRRQTDNVINVMTAVCHVPVHHQPTVTAVCLTCTYTMVTVSTRVHSASTHRTRAVSRVQRSAGHVIAVPGVLHVSRRQSCTVPAVSSAVMNLSTMSRAT